MFEKLYENVGAKIKGLAKWIFFLEALSAVISGIALLADGEVWFGLLTLVLGPVVALASSWLLYAFGQFGVVALPENPRDRIAQHFDP